MPLESIEVSTVLPASAERIYRAWLDSAEHSAFTGGQAVVDATVGGRHTAWDGYIEGVTLELDAGRRIVQSWRSEDFPDDSDDSRLEIRFEEGMDGTRVTIVHTEIPEGQGEDYRRGWVDHYFAPMARYFGAAPATSDAPAAAAMTAAPSEDLSAAWEDDALTPTSIDAPAPAVESVTFEESITEELEAPRPPKAKPAAPKKPKAKPAAKPAAKPVAKKPAAKAKAAAKKPAAKTKKAAKKPAAKRPAAKSKKPAKKPAAKAKKPAAKAKKPAAKPKKAAKKKGKR